MGQKAIKRVYDDYGDAGVAYVLYFGLPHSPFSHESDLHKRHELVVAEVAERKHKRGNKNVRFPGGFYKEETTLEAIDQACLVKCLPSEYHLMKLQHQAKHWNGLISTGKEPDADKLKVNIGNDSGLQGLVYKNRAEQRIEELHLMKMNAQTGVISLDEFFN